MAESMKNYLKKKKYKNYKGIIIAGNNHVVYHLGIPFRYKLAKKGIKTITIAPIILPEKDEKDEKDKDEDENPMLEMLKKISPLQQFFPEELQIMFSPSLPKKIHLSPISASMASLMQMPF